MNNSVVEKKGWLDKPLFSDIKITWITLIIAAILIIAFISRFYALDSRVMSHDETIHVYHNSWTLYRGSGYQHDPLSHGPLQTHLVALSYFLFGDSDFSARIPAALFSVAIVAITWNFRRYIGKTGALIAMLFMLISPYLLYYGRYVRNDIFGAFFGVVSIYAILRYLESGKDRYTILLTVATVLHFTAKETAYIYTLQIVIFLAFYFIYRIYKNPWRNSEQRKIFFISLLILLILLISIVGVLIINQRGAALNPFETAPPAIPGQELEQQPTSSISEVVLILAGLSLITLVIALTYLIRGFSWERIRSERSFGLLILLGTFVLPQGSAFLVNFVGWQIPTNATQVKAMTTINIIQIGIVLVPMFIASIIIGLLWNPKLWLKNAAVFYGIFVLLYTTVFTNGAGFFTGVVGSLGYWLEQQGVRRGDQPWYYYIGVQIPIYEYLPAITSVLSLVFLLLGIRPKIKKRIPEVVSDEMPMNDTMSEEIDILESPGVTDKNDIQITALVLLAYWSIISIISLTIAAEKMPWLTVHLAWPMILSGAWSIGYLVDTTDWIIFRDKKGFLTIAILLVFIVSTVVSIGSLLGDSPPFQGKELIELQATSTFLIAFITSVSTAIALIYLVKPWPAGTFIRVLSISSIGFLSILTARTAYQASFINYDYANELLVYAHSARGVKEVMLQVEEISKRTTDGLALSVAHDGEYPFWWYLRNYTNATYYGENPTRGLRDNAAIIVGANNFNKIEPVVGQGYNRFDYIRLWWPNQDYFNMTWQRIIDAIKNPTMRAALFDIWLNRDYSKYGEVKGIDMSYPNWSPSNAMRLYIRKDIVSQIWNYGEVPAAETIIIDPYEGKEVSISAKKMFGFQGNGAGQFMRPRGIAIGLDGSLFIADTDNNRIQHLAADGELINIWGEFGDITSGTALGGTFNQPWGIAVGPDGSVYVADTWNHRIQKFSSDGEFIRTWGYFGQAETPESFWGPRDVAVDGNGRVFITDTGNKRIVVFDEDGNFITEFGSVGMTPGQFDEPVGIGVDLDGNVYVADTWNQRIQIFTENQEGIFEVLRYWDVVGWYGESLDNKPYLTIDENGYVYATDPEGSRVLVFNNAGVFVLYWGDYGTGDTEFGLVGAVAVDDVGGIWVTDAGNSRIMYFDNPLPTNSE